MLPINSIIFDKNKKSIWKVDKYRLLTTNPLIDFYRYPIQFTNVIDYSRILSIAHIGSMLVLNILYLPVLCWCSASEWSGYIDDGSAVLAWTWWWSVDKVWKFFFSAVFFLSKRRKQSMRKTTISPTRKHLTRPTSDSKKVESSCGEHGR